jgi:hypothetical protein
VEKIQGAVATADGGAPTAEFRQTSAEVGSETDV